MQFFYSSVYSIQIALHLQMTVTLLQKIKIIDTFDGLKGLDQNT